LKQSLIVAFQGHVQYQQKNMRCPHQKTGAA